MRRRISTKTLDRMHNIRSFESVPTANQLTPRNETEIETAVRYLHVAVHKASEKGLTPGDLSVLRDLVEDLGLEFQEPTSQPRRTQAEIARERLRKLFTS